METLMSPNEYAAYLGISRTAVMKAIKKGRIDAIVDENGFYLINPRRANMQWLATGGKIKILKDEYTR